MFCGLHRTDVALRFCDETKVWLNLFWAYRPIYNGVKAYERTDYRANNAIIATHNNGFVIWLFPPVILPTHRYCVDLNCSKRRETAESSNNNLKKWSSQLCSSTVLS
jgi:hypothetical protein